MCVNAEANILTIDDASLAQQGLPPQQYHAFILFADEDIDFATEIIEKMEACGLKVWIYFTKDYIDIFSNFYDFFYIIFKTFLLFLLQLCVRERDLIGGTFEHDAILRMISERCERLVVVISKAFLKSSVNAFFVNFAQAMGIQHCQRKIIPCMLEPCQLPPSLSYLFALNYWRQSRYSNFWDKLRDSIKGDSLQVVNSNMNSSDMPR